jgi:NAD(P)-dependent dehydrogenase (short-subunit alcohol dehydrogenase family)
MALKDKRIIVLGGTSGIGLGSRKPRQDGAQVLVASSDEARVKRALPPRLVSAPPSPRRYSPWRPPGVISSPHAAAHCPALDEGPVSNAVLGRVSWIKTKPTIDPVGMAALGETRPDLLPRRGSRGFNTPPATEI